MTPWLDTCRLCVEDVRGVLERLPTRAEREPVLRRGEGGDDTTAVDQAAEDAVVERLRALGRDFVLVSEELGTLTFGAGGPERVVVDPIDGSVNAKRGIPFFSFSLAVAEGPTMDDVVFGYVYDFGSGEEWTAERGKGARLQGEQIGARAAEGLDRDPLLRRDDRRAIADRIEDVLALAGRVRVMGSLALSLCHLAAGRVDAVCSLKPARSVDIAAAQLLVRECGLAIELFDDPPFGRGPLDLVTRSRVAAAGSPELVQRSRRACSRARAGLRAYAFSPDCRLRRGPCRRGRRRTLPADDDTGARNRRTSSSPHRPRRRRRRRRRRAASRGPGRRCAASAGGGLLHGGRVPVPHPGAACSPFP